LQAMSHQTHMPLAGQAALVTGAARRVGAAIARTLHAAGANVLLHYKTSATAAESLAHELNGARAGSAKILQADLLDLSELAPLIDAAVGTFGRLDVLVNNASTFYATPIGAISGDDWDDLMGTNVKAPLFLSQAAAPALQKANGLIVNLVDIHGSRPLKRFAVYCAAKAALAMLTQSLARELAPHVRVNGIAPGPILWPEDAPDSETKAKIISQTLLQRQGSPDDVARTVLFFASDAPYITGQILAVDGGRSVGW
jgi:pteridine reductase